MPTPSSMENRIFVTTLKVRDILNIELILTIILCVYSVSYLIILSKYYWRQKIIVRRYLNWSGFRSELHNSEQSSWDL